MTHPEDPLRSYVRATLELQGYAFSDERVTEITAQFGRIAAIAEALLPSDQSSPNAPDLGTAAVFRP